MLSFPAWALDPPQFLFHWTTLGKLRYWAEKIEEKGRFVIVDPPIGLKNKPNTYIDLNLHQYLSETLYKTPKVFAWHHPIEAMGFGNKTYIKGDIPVLISFGIDPNARVFAVDFYEGKSWEKLRDQDGKLPDIIFHANSTFEEWIILNSEVVKKYSANPKNLNFRFKKYVKLLSSI